MRHVLLVSATDVLTLPALALRPNTSEDEVSLLCVGETELGSDVGGCGANSGGIENCDNPTEKVSEFSTIIFRSPESTETMGGSFGGPDIGPTC